MKSALLLTGLIWAAPSGASERSDPKAEKILGEIDATVNQWTDQFFTYEMIDKKPGSTERRLGLELYMKGEKRVTEFTAPADVKGTRILILSPTRMYVYLPAYKKVRRVASHVKAAGFMGTTYASDDLAIDTYVDKYFVTLVAEDDSAWVLDLVRRPKAEVAYPHLRLTASKEKKLPTKVEYFDDDGKHIKTERRGDYRCQGTVCVPFRMQMEDLRSPGHVTQIVSRDWKVNSNIPESVFTRRFLLRGR